MLQKQRKKYFVFNKTLDYQRGYMENLLCADQYLVMSKNQFGYGYFISRILDSKEQGNVWHRMTLETSEMDFVSYRITFYASDDSLNHVADVIKMSKSEMNIDQKKACFSPYLRLSVENTSDLLLHDVAGQYMWFLIEMYCPEGIYAQLGNLMVYFPKQTWVQYLPNVYDQSDQGDSFLERYLGIFQSLYDDLNRKIDDIPQYLEPETTDLKTLRGLADWLGINNIMLWPQEALKQLVSRFSDFYRHRGTVHGITKFVKLYTKEAPLIAEQHQIEKYTQNKTHCRLLKSLYGESPYKFTVCIKESCLPTGKEFGELQKIITDVAPAWMLFEIVILRPFILLDSYSYLGMNSVLGEYREFVLDGFSLLPFTTVGELNI